MENPKCWGKAITLIGAAMVDHQEDMSRGVFGYSCPMKIYRVLVEAGLMEDHDGIYAKTQEL